MTKIHATPGPWGYNGCIGRSEVGDSGCPEWSIGTDRGDFNVYGMGLRAYHGPKETREAWERATINLIAAAPELRSLLLQVIGLYEAARIELGDEAESSTCNSARALLARLE